MHGSLWPQPRLKIRQCGSATEQISSSWRELEADGVGAASSQPESTVNVRLFSSQLLYWIIPGQLACAHRPLRYHLVHGGSRLPLSPDAAPLIVKWAEFLQVEGIRSIITCRE